MLNKFSSYVLFVILLNGVFADDSKIGKEIPENKKPSPPKKNFNEGVNIFTIKYMFPRTISIVEIIFSKNSVDLRLRENIAIKSSPEELFLFISTFNKDGLN